MPYSLVPMVPNTYVSPAGITGTHPLALDFDGHAIRLNPTLALAWTPAEIPDVRVQTLGDDKDDMLPPGRRKFLSDLVPDRSVVAGARLKYIVADMLKTPPAGQWKPLMPDLRRRQLEILLGPGNFLGPGNQNPGLFWSEPADVRGPHSKDMQDVFTRTGNLQGSTSSDTQFTWSAQFADTVAKTNGTQADFTAVGVSLFWMYTASLSLDTADGYVQGENVSMNATNTSAGLNFRMDTGAGSGSDHGYTFHIDTNAALFIFMDLTGFVTINSTFTGLTSGTLYLQMAGTSYFCQRNGVTVLSGTDSAHNGSAGNRKVGVLVSCGDGRIVVMDNFRAADVDSGVPTGSAVLTGSLGAPVVGTRVTVPTP